MEQYFRVLNKFSVEICSGFGMYKVGLAIDDELIACQESVNSVGSSAKGQSLTWCEREQP